MPRPLGEVRGSVEMGLGGRIIPAVEGFLAHVGLELACRSRLVCSTPQAESAGEKRRERRTGWSPPPRSGRACGEPRRRHGQARARACGEAASRRRRPEVGRQLRRPLVAVVRLGLEAPPDHRLECGGNLRVPLAQRRQRAQPSGRRPD